MDMLYMLYRKVYAWVFRSEPSDFGKILFKNFLTAAAGTGIATVLTFGINVLAARYMGPEQFGKWNLIGSWAEFLVIVPLFGLTAAVPRYLGASDEQSKPEIIGSGFRITLVASIISFPIFWLVQKQFHIIQDQSLAWATFLYAIILAFFYLVQAFFQGMKQFKRLSILWVLSAFGFGGTVLFYLYSLHNPSFASLYWGNVIRLTFVVVVGLVMFGPALFRYSREKGKDLMHYGSYSMVSFAAGFFSLGSIDNIMINHYLGPAAVGLYAAYYVAFSVFIGKILNSFSQVFLPMAAGHNNLDALFKQVSRIYLKFFVWIFFAIFLLIWLLFKFYGKAYSFQPGIGGFLALNVSLYAFAMIAVNMVFATGVKGAKLGSILGICSAVINVTLNALLIPQFGLYGVVAGSLIATTAIISVIIYFVRRGFFIQSI